MPATPNNADKYEPVYLSMSSVDLVQAMDYLTSVAKTVPTDLTTDARAIEYDIFAMAGLVPFILGLQAQTLEGEVQDWTMTELSRQQKTAIDLIASVTDKVSRASHGMESIASVVQTMLVPAQETLQRTLVSGIEYDGMSVAEKLTAATTYEAARAAIDIIQGVANLTGPQIEIELLERTMIYAATAFDANKYSVQQMKFVARAFKLTGQLGYVMYCPDEVVSQLGLASEDGMLFEHTIANEPIEQLYAIYSLIESEQLAHADAMHYLRMFPRAHIVSVRDLRSHGQEPQELRVDAVEFEAAKQNDAIKLAQTHSRLWPLHARYFFLVLSAWLAASQELGTGAPIDTTNATATKLTMFVLLRDKFADLLSYSTNDAYVYLHAHVHAAAIGMAHACETAGAAGGVLRTMHSLLVLFGIAYQDPEAAPEHPSSILGELYEVGSIYAIYQEAMLTPRITYVHVDSDETSHKSTRMPAGVEIERAERRAKIGPRTQSRDQGTNNRKVLQNNVIQVIVDMAVSYARDVNATLEAIRAQEAAGASNGGSPSGSAPDGPPPSPNPTNATRTVAEVVREYTRQQAADAGPTASEALYTDYYYPIKAAQYAVSYAYAAASYVGGIAVTPMNLGWNWTRGPESAPPGTRRIVNFAHGTPPYTNLTCSVPGVTAACPVPAFSAVNATCPDLYASSTLRGWPFGPASAKTVAVEFMCTADEAGVPPAVTTASAPGPSRAGASGGVDARLIEAIALPAIVDARWALADLYREAHGIPPSQDLAPEQWDDLLPWSQANVWGAAGSAIGLADEAAAEEARLYDANYDPGAMAFVAVMGASVFATRLLLHFWPNLMRWSKIQQGPPTGPLDFLSRPYVYASVGAAVLGMYLGPQMQINALTAKMVDAHNKHLPGLDQAAYLFARHNVCGIVSAKYARYAHALAAFSGALCMVFSHFRDWFRGGRVTAMYPGFSKDKGRIGLPPQGFRIQNISIAQITAAGITASAVDDAEKKAWLYAALKYGPDRLRRKTLTFSDEHVAALKDSITLLTEVKNLGKGVVIHPDARAYASMRVVPPFQYYCITQPLDKNNVFLAGLVGGSANNPLPETADAYSRQSATLVLNDYIATIGNTMSSFLPGDERSASRTSLTEKMIASLRAHEHVLERARDIVWDNAAGAMPRPVLHTEYDTLLATCLAGYSTKMASTLIDAIKLEYDTPRRRRRSAAACTLAVGLFIGALADKSMTGFLFGNPPDTSYNDATTEISHWIETITSQIASSLSKTIISETRRGEVPPADFDRVFANASQSICCVLYIMHQNCWWYRTSPEVRLLDEAFMLATTSIGIDKTSSWQQVDMTVSVLASVTYMVTGLDVHSVWMTFKLAVALLKYVQMARKVGHQLTPSLKLTMIVVVGMIGWVGVRQTWDNIKWLASLGLRSIIEPLVILYYHVWPTLNTVYGDANGSWSGMARRLASTTRADVITVILASWPLLLRYGRGAGLSQNFLARAASATSLIYFSNVIDRQFGDKGAQGIIRRAFSRPRLFPVSNFDRSAMPRVVNATEGQANVTLDYDAIALAMESGEVAGATTRYPTLATEQQYAAYAREKELGAGEPARVHEALLTAKSGGYMLPAWYTPQAPGAGPAEAQDGSYGLYIGTTGSAAVEDPLAWPSSVARTTGFAATALSTSFAIQTLAYNFGTLDRGASAPYAYGVPLAADAGTPAYRMRHGDRSMVLTASIVAVRDAGFLSGLLYGRTFDSVLSGQDAMRVINAQLDALSSSADADHSSADSAWMHKCVLEQLYSVAEGTRRPTDMSLAWYTRETQPVDQLPAFEPQRLLMLECKLVSFEYSPSSDTADNAGLYVLGGSWKADADVFYEHMRTVVDEGHFVVSDYVYSVARIWYSQQVPAETMPENAEGYAYGSRRERWLRAWGVLAMAAAALFVQTIGRQAGGSIPSYSIFAKRLRGARESLRVYFDQLRQNTEYFVPAVDIRLLLDGGSRDRLCDVLVREAHVLLRKNFDELKRMDEEEKSAGGRGMDVVEVTARDFYSFVDLSYKERRVPAGESPPYVMIVARTALSTILEENAMSFANYISIRRATVAAYLLSPINSVAWDTAVNSTATQSIEGRYRGSTLILQARIDHSVVADVVSRVRTLSD